MSHHSGPYGGGYQSPLTERDKKILRAVKYGFYSAVLLFAAWISWPLVKLVAGVRWWVFG